jgi:hypothetical protein
MGTAGSHVPDLPRRRPHQSREQRHSATTAAQAVAVTGPTDIEWIPVAFIATCVTPSETSQRAASASTRRTS